LGYALLDSEVSLVRFKNSEPFRGVRVKVSSFFG
jgi:hypothetical protein